MRARFRQCDEGVVALCSFSSASFVAVSRASGDADGEVLVDAVVADLVGRLQKDRRGVLRKDAPLSEGICNERTPRPCWVSRLGFGAVLLWNLLAFAGEGPLAVQRPLLCFPSSLGDFVDR